MRITSVILPLLVAIPLMLFTACSTEPVIEVTSQEICEQYWDNEIRADTEYKNKDTIVRGDVGCIGRDGAGVAYILLPFKWNKTMDFGAVDNIPMPEITFPDWLCEGGYSVECKFDEKDEAEIAPLESGDHVFVKGVCQGLVRDKLGLPLFIVLEHCRVVN